MKLAWQRCLRAIVLCAMTAGFATSAQAQTIIPYGPNITLEQARSVVAAAKVEAVKNSWPVAITIVDASGYLVAFERMDNTQLGSVHISQEKARCSVLFRKTTKAFEDGVAAGGPALRFLKTPGVIPVEGGVPILFEGKIVGAIGVSGVQPSQDGQVAAAGVEAIKPAK